jgi:catechol 2,3-dioxygenase-like lactoylglutathione lyase family enzyme
MSDPIQLLVNIDVPDLDAATKFYVEAFGFRVGRRMGGAGIELLGAGVPLYLLPKPAGSPAAETTSAQRSYLRHWTPLHLDLAVPDVAAARARALAAGATAEGETSEHVWGRMARLADPYGHGVCLIEFRGRGYDELAAG